MASLSEEEKPVIILVCPVSSVAIFATRRGLKAHAMKPVGDFVLNEIKEKTYPYIDDLFELPMRGLAKLAVEFLKEIKDASAKRA